MYKHPTPWDFFDTVEDVSGRDLSWFWRGWYFNNWNLDLAVKGAVPDKEGWDKGAVVTIANQDRLVMPSIVEVAFAGGEKQRIALPAETWIQKSEVEMRLDSTKPILSVTVDPDHVVPDRDRANNVLKPVG